MAKPPPSKHGVITPQPAVRPSHTPSKESRALVKVMAAGGIEQAHMAGALGISRPTLRKHYKTEIAHGGSEANAQVVAALFKAAVGSANAPGNVKAQIWWTQSRMGWRETMTVENVGKDGRPIEQTVTYRWAEPKAE